MNNIQSKVSSPATQSQSQKKATPTSPENLATSHPGIPEIELAHRCCDTLQSDPGLLSDMQDLVGRFGVPLNGDAPAGPAPTAREVRDIVNRMDTHVEPRSLRNLMQAVG